MSEDVKAYVSSRCDEQAWRSRERILGTARATFRERGYGATTLTDVARAAGVAEPTSRDVQNQAVAVIPRAALAEIVCR